MTEFESFALDHGRHTHCMGCGGCILDRRTVVQDYPVWCAGCVTRIKENLAPGIPAPWERTGGFVIPPEEVKQ